MSTVSASHEADLGIEKKPTLPSSPRHIRVHNPFRAKENFRNDSIRNFLNSKDSSNFSVVCSTASSTRDKRKNARCVLELYSKSENERPSNWLSFLLSSTSQKQIIENMKYERFLSIPWNDPQACQFSVAKYFENHRFSELGAVCVRVHSFELMAQNTFYLVRHGISLIKNELSNVKTLVVIIQDEAYFHFSLNDSNNSNAIECVLKEFEILILKIKTTWKFNETAKHFLEKEFELDIELTEILAPASYYPQFSDYDTLDEVKKNKIIWCFTTNCSSFNWELYPQLESLCRVYYAIGRDFQRHLFDFFMNHGIWDILLVVEDPNLVFRLPGEMNSSNNTPDNIAKNAAATPYPLRNLKILNEKYTDFNLNRISFSCFSNLVKLTLQVNNVIGVLQGKLLTSLKELRVCRLHKDATLDFSDVEEPLSILRLEDCSGRVLMKACPATFEVVGPFKVNDENTFFANVRNLSIQILKEDDIKQWQHLIGLKFEDFENADNKYPGKMVEMLSISYSAKLLETLIYIQNNSVLKELTCSHMGAVIDGSRLSKLESLSVSACKLKLISTFERLKHISLEHVTLTGSWNIKIKKLRTMKWSSGMVPQPYICVDNEAIRGFFDNATLQEFKKTSKLKTLEKRTLCPKLEALDWSSRPNDFTSIVADIQIFNISQISLDIPIDTWFTFPGEKLNCKTAFFSFFQKKKSLSNSSKKKVKLPSMPKVRNLTVSTFQNANVYLDTLMPKLENLTVDTHVRYGEELCCPNIRFVEVTGKSDEKNAHFVISALNTKKFGMDINGNGCSQTILTYFQMDDVVFIKRPLPAVRVNQTKSAKLNSLSLAPVAVANRDVSPLVDSSVDSVVAQSDQSSTQSVHRKMSSPLNQYPPMFMSSRNSWCSCCFSVP